MFFDPFVFLFFPFFPSENGKKASFPNHVTQCKIAHFLKHLLLLPASTQKPPQAAQREEERLAAAAAEAERREAERRAALEARRAFR